MIEYSNITIINKDIAETVINQIIEEILYENLQQNILYIDLNKLGTSIKKKSIENRIIFKDNIRNKCISPNTFIKKNYKNISYFIKNHTKYTLDLYIKI